MAAHESASPALGTDERLIASRLHTLVVLGAVAASAYLGTRSAARIISELHPHRVRVYLFGIGEEWLMFGLILWGVARAHTPLSRVLGERWHSRRELLRDIGIAAGFWIVSVPVFYGVRVLLGTQSTGPAVLALIPRNALEVALWIAVSVTAGICEETIFRGYLQRQLMVMTRSRPAGVLLAAVAFGSVHIYQGWRMAITLGLYGLMLGVLAYGRRSVRPGMIAHAWQDGFAGVVGGIVLRRWLR